MTKNSLLVLVPLIAALAANVCAAESVQLVKTAFPTLTSGSLASARLIELPPGTIMRSGEIKITQKDLDAEVGKAPVDVRPQLKRNLFFVLENMATEMLVNYEASDWAKSTNAAAGTQDELVKAYIQSITGSVSVTDEELKGFFEANKDMVGGATFDQVREQLRRYLLEQKQQAAVSAHIAAISERYVIDVNKAWTAKQNSAATDNPIDQARRSGKPTMVDLGADGCRPCEMMTPILEELKTDYAGKANVLFVHVRKEQILAARYGVQSIPVQVFFDKGGKEAFRHVGFFPKDQITAKLAELGAK